MPISQVPNIIRVTWQFTYALGGVEVEVADMSVCFQAGAVPTVDTTLAAVLHDMANAAYASVVAHVNKVYWPTNIGLALVRVALEGTNGHTLAEQFSHYGDAGSWNGTGTGNSLPWDNALCVSLYAYQPGSFDPLGKSKRGRFYLPTPVVQILSGDNSGMVLPETAATIADEWGTVLQEIQQHDYSGFPTLDPVLVVNSRRQGDAYPVTYIRIDNKMDSQRRRYNKELAVVATAPYPSS